MRKLTAVLVTAVAVAACTTSRDDSESADTSPAETELTETPDTEAVDETDDTPVDVSDSTEAPSDTEVEATEDTEPVDTEPADTEVEATEDEPETTESAIEPIVDDRAPGVTDDTIQVSAVYVAPRSDGRVRHGDYELAFQAVADAINERGNLHGRQIELTFVQEDTEASDGATASCTAATQDAGAFVVVGGVRENAGCYVDNNETLLVGGRMTPTLLEQAKVGWVTPGDTADIEGAAVQAMIDAGLLDGTVGVIGTGPDEEIWESAIAPVFDDAGIDVVGPAFIDISSGDVAAVNNSVDTTLERFEADGVDQLVAIGNAIGFFFTARVAETDYAPTLRITNLGSANLYLSNENADMSVMDGAVAGGQFDDTNAYVDLGGRTDECIEILNAAGHTIIPENEVPDGEEQNVSSGSIVCSHMYLLEDILAAAGPELNYGTFTTAAYSLGETELPFRPGTMFFGPPPQADGEPEAILYDFDPTSNTFVER